MSYMRWLRVLMSGWAQSVSERPSVIVLISRFSLDIMLIVSNISLGFIMKVFYMRCIELNMSSR